MISRLIDLQSTLRVGTDGGLPDTSQRVTALDGKFTFHSTLGAGTELHVEVAAP